MIYLDVCCLNRPFDDHTQDRIRLESEAVLTILSGCEKGRFYLVSSKAIEYEISVTLDNEKKEKVLTFMNLAHERILMEVTQRANANDES